MPPLPPRGLYVITDGPRDDLLDAVARALAGGARLVQYRDKTADAARRLAEARALKALCAAHGVPLIVNDDIALAQAAGADGVHLGEHDGSLAQARAQLGERAIIGVSCYDSLARARAAAAEGASYVAFGAFFPSPTKPRARRADPGLLRQSAALGVPRVAIGGITADNARPLVDAGADYLAVISAVFGAADIAAAARRLADLHPCQRASER
ncbi:thiamine phosphate synthase [Fulvimonas soli]|jgi:thiamine-phosphate pyrophosphorylase|uniref:Thiamine-phosphate synthase n=1 Tax=Fulvimonas soli TaxID=155197 RepID=A0A316I2Q3_9GAMM|nr:thiamine phosphate synthase [Fulvimonas soli]PWK86613.1 thiamine-phosphate diphosphorylase [Fulvimonas soli]TNY25542.1 thiamine-phosphate diphosphorylase [Fulvimonas soli]